MVWLAQFDQDIPRSDCLLFGKRSDRRMTSLLQKEEQWWSFFLPTIMLMAHCPGEDNIMDEEKPLAKNCEGELWIIRKVC
jgi:hypothetical protein